VTQRPVKDPRRPVIVGAGQTMQRPDNPSDAVEALELMVESVKVAAADAGTTKLLADIDFVAVVSGAWGYSDPGRLIAQAIGAHSAGTGLSTVGGNSPQGYLSALAARIAEGQLDRAVLVGAETIWSRRRVRRANLRWTSTKQTGVEPSERFGQDVAMADPFAQSRGISAPVHYYPMFESAIRGSRGRTFEEHRHQLGQLWAGFNQVAVNNEHAWNRTAMSAEEIITPTAANRMVGFPYTKAMNSNWDLDQGAAVIITSYEAAVAAGISADKMVFPWVGTEATDRAEVASRRDLHSSPAIEAAGSTAFKLTGLGPDDIDHLDIYSCFPSAVQIAVAELGFGTDRQLTQTGGLTFAGGPLNNYVTHSISAMVDTLRHDPGSLGMVTANGGFLTKHALGIYSTTPPAEGFLTANAQDEADQAPTTIVDKSHHGPVAVEAYTVMHDREGATEALCALQTPTGGRTWGRVNDPTAAAEMTEVDAIGQSGSLDPEGSLTLD